MIKRHLIKSLFFFAAVASLLGCSHVTMRTTITPDLLALDDIMTSGIESGIYPGGVLVMGKGDKILWAKAYGRHTWEKDAPPMELDTIFDMASVSKVLGTTQAAFVNLEDGKLSLDDKVAQHIPGFEANGKGDITIKDLMTHVSGLKPYENKDRVEEGRKPGESHADALIRTYANLELNYKPRTRSRYSCLNFQTLARVNENVSGERMENLLIRRVYGPMGMKDTRYVLTEEQKRRAAPTIRRKTGELNRGETHDPLANYHGSSEHCPGNAGLFSTAPDLTRFCRMVLNEGEFEGKRIFQAETIRMATRRQTPLEIDSVRGLGFQIHESAPWSTNLNDTPETHIVSHYGYTGTRFWIDKLSGAYFVYLTNRTFPYKEGETDQAPSDSAIQKKICNTVLRSLPEYREYFKNKGGR
jgi:CubicO group peptidase (beta-lactamase class C family)